VQHRPTDRARAAVRFDSLEAGAAAARGLAQGGLYPSNCRLLDATEVQLSGAAPMQPEGSLLLLAFEAAGHTVGPWLDLALACCADHGGSVVAGSARRGGAADAAHPDDPADAWRGAFLRAPYLRDVLVSMGMIVETFETAVTWDRWAELHATVTAVVDAAVRAVGASNGLLACRFTHVYPDGPALYFTVIAPGRRGAELEQWSAIKAAASDAILAGGATITHHHAVGRDHRSWYDRERPDLFAEALVAAKSALDPAWILNPGVLLPAPERRRP
jgi:alkyldihydroxyacetonephosphate synthase